MAIILFILGLAFGSFFNVVILRYDGERALFSSRALGGRSHCPHCRATLRWYELIPLLSFLSQGGRCRHCHVRLSPQYPIVELLTALLFIFVWQSAASAALAALWIAVFSALLLLSVIDLRLGLIPDELIILLCAAGLCVLFASGADLALWWNRLLGAGVGLGIFGGLRLLTRGRGMGMGDVKLAVPLGLLFGWPSIVGVAMAAFILGAVAGIAAILFQKKTMQSTIPFGPFLVLGAVMVFFWGPAIINWYLGIMSMG
jgi:prepilin signal peptidase PulO-like enzyme (type II secretory pathway)